MRLDQEEKLFKLTKTYGFRYELISKKEVVIYIKHRLTSHLIKQIEFANLKFIDVFQPFNDGKEELRANFEVIQ